MKGEFMRRRKIRQTRQTQTILAVSMVLLVLLLIVKSRDISDFNTNSFDTCGYNYSNNSDDLGDYDTFKATFENLIEPNKVKFLR